MSTLFGIPCGLLVLVGLISACGPRSQNITSDITVVDAMNNEIRIPRSVNRVATLAPGATEIVVVAGGLHTIVGVSTADDFPAEISTLPRYSALPVNYEAIVALEPDLVFATDQVNNYRDVAVLQNLGIPTLFLRSRTLDDVLESIGVVAGILNTTETADAVVDSLRSRVDCLSRRAEGLPRPRVLFLISSGMLHTFGSESYMHDLIELAGGASITASVDIENPILSDEFVLSANPEIIVGSFGGDFEISELLRLHPTWHLVDAIQTEQVFSVDGNLLLRAGPRVVDGAEELFSRIHPTAPSGCPTDLK